MATRRHVLHTLAAAMCMAGLPAAARALVVDRLVHLVLGFPAGGGADSTARTLAERLRGSYAQTVIVENRPGARGVPPANAVLGADPDGSVLYLAPNSVSTLWPQVYRSLPYDPIRDFLPVAMLADLEFGLAVGPGVPVDSVAEYIAWVKADPARAMFGTLGIGSVPEFVCYAFARSAGMRLTPVPYRGSGPGVLDLLGGRIPAWFGPLGDFAAYQREGKAKVLASTGSERSRFLTGVPTFAELGFPRVVARESWGVYVRNGTPPALVEKLAGVLVDIASQPSFRAVMNDLNYNVRAVSTNEFRSIILGERARWTELVRESGFKPED